MPTNKPTSLAELRKSLKAEASESQQILRKELGTIWKDTQETGRQVSFMAIGAVGAYLILQFWIQRSRNRSLRRLARQSGKNQGQQLPVYEKPESSLVQTIKISIANFLLNLARKELGEWLKHYAEQLKERHQQNQQQRQSSHHAQDQSRNSTSAAEQRPPQSSAPPTH